jgi:hypothetical protein
MRIAADEVIPVVSGDAVTITLTLPRFEGFHVQDAFQVDADPDVLTETHPLRRFPSAVKVTLDSRFMVTLIVDSRR